MQPQITAAGTALMLLALSGIVHGQDYPQKPIRIVTAAAGGGSDFMARQIAQGITGPLGQPVVVENRGGLLTAEIVSKAPPDGYTVSLSGGALWIGPLLQKLPYDVIRDFTPVSLIVREVSVLAIHPSLPAKSVRELITFAKSRPGQLNYASTSVGGSGQLAMELFKSMAGVDIVNVVYKGNAPGITALISGEVQAAILDAGLIMPQVKSGRLRALAVTSATPSALVPELPTLAASGLPGYESIGISGILGPAKVPTPIVNRLNQEIVRVLNRPDIKQTFLNSGEEVVASSPDQFADAIRSDIAKWDKVIKQAGIKVE